MIPPPAEYRKRVPIAHGYRGLRRRNFSSRVISGGFCIYRIFGHRNHAKVGHEEGTTHLGMPGPPGMPRCLVLTSLIFWSFHEASGVSFLLEKIIKKFCSIWRTLIFCTKNNTMVVLLKTASVRVSSNQIIPKPYRIVINMA